jgi:hypothetical protein
VRESRSIAVSGYGAAAPGARAGQWLPLFRGHLLANYLLPRLFRLARTC